ncbi:zinc ion binding / nucleic acid binding protein, partial [Thalictrum thalictroides]
MATSIPKPPSQLLNSDNTNLNQPLVHPSNTHDLNQGILVVDLTPVKETNSKGNTFTGEENRSEPAVARWNSLLKKQPPSAGMEEMTYLKPNFCNGVLEIEDEIVEEGVKEWEDRLVGFFLDKKLPFSFVQEAVKKRWEPKGDLNIGLDGDMYYFKFGDPTDRERALEEGPMYFAGKLFIVRPWNKEVEVNKGSIRSVPVWAKLFNIPKQLWTAKGLSKLASSFGIPLFMDKTTETRQMLTFARICVDIKAEEELPSQITVKVSNKEVVIPIEFPWKPLVCTKCKVFGHSTKNCEPQPYILKNKQIERKRDEQGWQQQNSKRTNPRKGTTLDNNKGDVANGNKGDVANGNNNAETTQSKDKV